ncbi:hypothetical protein P5673_019661 [Acropora cervicornis]|uniref:Uncharacterized protein n=1 Tax=Acropora cervicornis TaxID=6130 RepID=A0AAD9QB59_ACRCE|nr:hypothetical protein P5673_019661 [Acropora cervicornis]
MVINKTRLHPKSPSFPRPRNQPRKGKWNGKDFTPFEGIPDYGLGCRSPTAVDSEFRVSLLVTMLYDQNISSDVFNPGRVREEGRALLNQTNYTEMGSTRMKKTLAKREKKDSKPNLTEAAPPLGSDSSKMRYKA